MKLKGHSSGAASKVKNKSGLLFQIPFKAVFKKVSPRNIVYLRVYTVVYLGYCIVIRIHKSVFFILKLNFFQHVEITAASVLKTVVDAANCRGAESGLRSNLRINYTVR